MARASFPLACVGAAVLVVAAWANHFDNGFQFDDFHTVENNLAIRSLSNLPRFFTDARSTSTLPTHQAWRPGVVTLHAVDVALGGTGEPRAVVFHRSIFAAFVLLCVAAFFLFKRVLDQARPADARNRWWALFATTLFAVHTANAETINYVSARSDSASTLMVVLAFLAWLSPRARRFGLPLLCLAAAFVIKEPAVMFVALLGLYVVLFESPSPLHVVRTVWPVALLGVALVVLSRVMTPSTWTAGAPPALEYVATQPFVVLHYVFNFALPLNLAIDTDARAVESFTDDRVFAGVFFVGALLVLSWRAARVPHWRPVAFGLLWFLATLLPTSVVPLGEVLNDHRPFFGYLGLCLATAWTWALVSEGWVGFPGRAARIAVPVALLLAHAWGVHVRNQVWGDDVKLWGQAAARAPLQVRNHMNYGNALLKLGRWQEAEAALLRAKDLAPHYSYVWINLGVCANGLDRPAEAEANFRHSLELDPNIPDAWLRFAEWLRDRGRLPEADANVQRGLAVSPAHVALLALKQQLAPRLEQSNRNVQVLQTVSASPSAAGFLDLSLAFYSNGEHDLAMASAREALKLEPQNPYAFNNLCAAGLFLHQWEQAVGDCRHALDLAPTFEVARNNLALALQKKTP